MRWLRTCLILWLLAFAPAAAHAGSRQEEACTLASARPVTIAGLNKARARLDGQCVRLTAYQIENMIFEAREDFYKHFASTRNKAANVVGIAYDGKRWDSEHPRRATFVGRVVDCAAQQRRFARADRRRSSHMSSSGEIVLTHHYGFCGSNVGPALYLDDIVDAADTPLDRITEGEVADRIGDLELAPAGFDFHGKLTALVDLSLKKGCAPNFKPDPRLFQDDKERSVTVDASGPDDSRRAAFSGDVCKVPASETRLYLISPASPHREANAQLDMLACACRTGDCTGRWPVALFDTNWNPARPYFCQRISYVPHKQSGTGRHAELSDWWFQFPANNGLWFEKDPGWFTEKGPQ